MKFFRHLICLSAALLLCLCPRTQAEAVLTAPAAIVSYDRTELDDWTPGYGLSMPGVLLELTHAEGMLSVSALETDGLSPKEYLSGRLDRAAETLSVSDAQLTGWDDSFGGDGRSLSFSYTYPDGDEVHLCRIWASSFDGMLIELSIDTWGMDNGLLMDTACRAFIENGFSLTLCENAARLTAALSDVIEGEDGLARVQLTMPSENAIGSSAFYALSPEAVVLFPNPDDPSLLYPVSPDMPSLTDAILTYEDSSDSPAVFYTVIEDGTIMYMEYSLLP